MSDGRPAQRTGEPGEPKAAKQPMPPRRIWVAFLAALLANFLVMRLFFPSADEVTVPYTAFKAEVEKRNLEYGPMSGDGMQKLIDDTLDMPPAVMSRAIAVSRE